MEKDRLKKIVECLLFVSLTPVSLERFSEITGESKEVIEKIIDELKSEYTQRSSPFQVVMIASGYQFATLPEYKDWIKKLYKSETTYKLSQQGLETLSIIAYKQPITKVEIDKIRGIDSSGVIRTLLEKKLIKICGKKRTIGRPLLYRTSDKFLHYFGLYSLEQLPSLEDFEREIT